ncbi:hypothetical protein BH11BAC7_BH11BAC7_02470 [soil metagenome]
MSIIIYQAQNNHMKLPGKKHSFITQLLFIGAGVILLFLLHAFTPAYNSFFSLNNKDSLIINTLYHKSKKPDSKFSIDYPVLKNALSDSLEKVRNEEFLSQANYIKKIHVQSIKDLYNNTNDDCRNSSEDFSFVIKPGLLTKRCLSYLIEKDGISFCTPHSFHSIECVTIDLNTGKRLALKDLFLGIDSTVWANTLSMKASNGYFSEALGFTPANSIFFEPGIYFSYEQFVLNDSSIDFYIDPIYINEGVEGQVDIWMSIPYTEIKSIIHPGSLLWDATH